MKRNTFLRTAAGVLTLGMAAGLAGCGATADTSSSSVATADSAASSEPATSEEAADAYAYLANFSFSDAFDENGYLSGIKASDYVTLPDGYDKMTLASEINTVAADDITTYINSNILANYKTTEQVTDRAAVSGDSVNIDYAGTIDGVAFDGGTSTAYDLTLGSGTFIDGFEDQIIGHTPGESFDVNVTFPETYSKADLAGKAAVFATTLNYISEQVTPELTDTWVTDNLNESLGLSTVDALNAYVSDTLLFDQQSSNVYSQLNETATIADELPDALTSYLESWYLYSPYQYSQMYGVGLEELLGQSGYDTVDSYLEAAQSSILSMGHQILVMQAIAENKGLTCDTDTMNAEFERYFGTSDPTSYTENYGENYIKMNILHDVVMQGLIDSAVKE